jgi:hypothetical protein
MTTLLHNMSVPASSRIMVARALLPGLRFRVRLDEQVGLSTPVARERLSRKGWSAAWDMLESVGDVPRRAASEKGRRDLLERHIEQAKAAAGIPERLGIFVCESGAESLGPLLSPAAALAVLCRRSGPLYLPARRPEPSLVNPMALILFFPEESR